MAGKMGKEEAKGKGESKGLALEVEGKGAQPPATAAAAKKEADYDYDVDEEVEGILKREAALKRLETWSWTGWSCQSCPAPVEQVVWELGGEVLHDDELWPLCTPCCDLLAALLPPAPEGRPLLLPGHHPIRRFPMRTVALRDRGGDPAPATVAAAAATGDRRPATGDRGKKRKRRG